MCHGCAAHASVAPASQPHTAATPTGARVQREDTSHLNQFIIHAALDMVDDSVWGTQSMYLKCVHKFNGASAPADAFVGGSHPEATMITAAPQTTSSQRL
eukprot:2008112-Prymnesium_polylepis.3